MTIDSSNKVSTELKGTKVYFDSFPAPLIYTQDQSVCVVVPYEIAGQQTTQIHVEYQGPSSSFVSLPVTASSQGSLQVANSSGICKIDCLQKYEMIVASHRLC